MRLSLPVEPRRIRDGSKREFAKKANCGGFWEVSNHFSILT